MRLGRIPATCIGLVLCLAAGAVIASPLGQMFGLALGSIVLALALFLLLRVARLNLVGFIVLALFGGYVVLNRDFAELHLPFGSFPIYVGELVLALGLVWALTRRSDMRSLINEPYFLALFAWQAYCAARLLAGGLAYGVDALRDSAVWYYGFFAIIGFVIWPRVERRTWMWFFGLSFSGLIVTSTIFAVAGPLTIPIPGADPQFPVKVDRADVMSVGLIAAATFFLLAIRGDAWYWPRVLIAAASLALLLPLEVRAASLGFLLLMIVLVVQGRWKVVVPLTVLPAAAVGFVLVFGVPLAGRYSSESPDSLVTRQLSTFGLAFGGQATTSNPTVDTAAWRVAWWSALISETTSEPESIVTGLGFGTDLTAPLQAQFGVQVDETGRPVRSPHNFLITLFARTGIVGLGMWLITEVLWLMKIASALHKARTGRLHDHADMLLWMSGWALLTLVAATLGVVLEGPYGAIPYYLLMGMSLRCATEIATSAPSPYARSAVRSVALRRRPSALRA